MRVALIPPVSLLEDTEKTDMQLMLPNVRNQIYQVFYRRHVRDPQQYVILDNGAAEKERISDAELMLTVRLLVVDEFALPDHLYDTEQTVAHADQFMKEHGKAIFDDMPEVALGYVAQGHDAIEAFYGVQQIVDKWGYAISTIFLPRLLVRTYDLTARLQLAHLINDTWPDRFNIHLFGASKYWPGEVAAAQNLYYIRSIDTSLPYQLSFAKAKMRRRPEKMVDRPQWYFQRARNEFSNSDIYVERYLKWAHANIPTPSVKSAH